MDCAHVLDAPLFLQHSRLHAGDNAGSAVALHSSPPAWSLVGHHGPSQSKFPLRRGSPSLPTIIRRVRHPPYRYWYLHSAHWLQFSAAHCLYFQEWRQDRCKGAGAFDTYADIRSAYMAKSSLHRAEGHTQCRGSGRASHPEKSWTCITRGLASQRLCTHAILATNGTQLSTRNLGREILEKQDMEKVDAGQR